MAPETSGSDVTEQPALEIQLRVLGEELAAAKLENQRLMEQLLNDEALSIDLDAHTEVVRAERDDARAELERIRGRLEEAQEKLRKSRRKLRSKQERIDRLEEQLNNLKSSETWQVGSAVLRPAVALRRRGAEFVSALQPNAARGERPAGDSSSGSISR